MTETPSAYVEGYEKKVLPHDKAAADNYIKHTMIGDPVMDEIMEELSSLPPRNLHRFVEAGIEQQDDTLAIAPKSCAISSTILKNLPGSITKPSVRGFAPLT